MVLVLGVISFLIGGILGLRSKNEKLTETNNEVRSFTQASFIESTIKNSNGDFIEKKKEKLLEKEKDFITINLEEMKVKLYRKGKLSETYPVLSKGKEGSWWETPTGSYNVVSKEASHYSSIGEVWMPWSIKFYGNFYVHGWPYYPNGQPVREEFSGGCIRLSDEVAKSVFKFVEREMPLLLYNEEGNKEVASLEGNSKLKPPQITAESAFVADFETGQVILNKNADSVKPIASVTKLMSGVVASEVIYLERQVKINERMLRDAVQSYPLQVGSTYKVFDLLYPFLQQSSNGAGRAIAASFGEERFIKQMNKKADSLGMDNSEFVDPNGVSKNNVSSLREVFKLANYILEKRRFLYDISKGEDYHVFGPTSFANIETYNEFHDNSNLVGAKNGKTEAAGQTYASVWKFEYNNKQRYIFIGILDSENRKKDAKEIVDWLEENFKLQ